MTQAFAANFHMSGFGIVKNAVASAEAEDLMKRLVDLLPPASQVQPLQLIVPRIVEHDSAFADIGTSNHLVTLLAEIFGVTPQLVCSYGHQKAANTDSHTGPHSDVAHLPGVPHDRSTLMVKAMLALTPIHDGSGGTVIIPGSHRQPEARAAGRYMSMEPGDLVLFHANVRHTATANRSDSPRLSLWYVYALPWMRVFPGYEYSTDFLARMQPRLAAEPHLRALLGLNDPYATNRP